MPLAPVVDSVRRKRVRAGSQNRWSVEVRRDRILADVGQSEPALLSVIAPAGYGKTTVVRAYAATWTRSATCDCYGVDTVAEFARRIVEALVALGDPPSNALAAEAAAVAGDARALHDLAVTAWRTGSALPGLLVFENAEFVARQPALRALLAELLDRPHPSRGVAICSRVPVGIRTTRFAAPHQTVELQAQDLRFDRAEIVQVCREAKLSAANLDEIERSTRGWPIGVLFLARAAIVGKLSGTLSEFGRRGEAALREYVAQEIIAGLGAQQFNALIACAAIPNPTAADVALVLECDVAVAGELVAQLPLVGIERTSVYDVHPLLRAALEEWHGAAWRAVLERTAAAHIERGERVRAAELYLAAENQAAAAMALGDAEGSFLLVSPDVKVCALIAAIDWPTLQHHPALWNLSTMVRTYSRSQHDWLSEARVVWSRLPDTARVDVRAGVLNSLANVCAIMGLFDEARAAVDRFAASLGPDERQIGEVVLAMWHCVLRVWEGLPADVDAATRAAAAALQDDTTNALWNYNVLARHARSYGQRSAEDVYLQRAYDSAMRCGFPTAGALVLSDIIVGAWLWGNDERFASALDELERTVTQSAYRGVRFFIECCRGSGRTASQGFEKLKFRAFGYLIAAGMCDLDEDARFCVRAAMLAADEAQTGFVQALARVALAIVEPERSAELLAQAATFAARLESTALMDAIRSVRSGEDRGMLATFVRRFEMRRERSQLANPIIELRLFDWTLERNGDRVALKSREFEVLVALAIDRRPLERRRLAERIWPDSPLADGVNALKVNISRLRRVLGADSIVSVDGAYTLGRTIVVDLETVEQISKSARFGQALNASEREAFSRAAHFDAADIATRTRRWEWFGPPLARLELLAREAAICVGRDLLDRGLFSDAIDAAQALLLRDGCDEGACELALRARLALGDRRGARAVLLEHERAMAAELGAEVAPRLRTLVTDGMGGVFGDVV